MWEFMGYAVCMNLPPGRWKLQTKPSWMVVTRAGGHAGHHMF